MRNLREICEKSVIKICEKSVRDEGTCEKICEKSVSGSMGEDGTCLSDLREKLCEQSCLQISMGVFWRLVCAALRHHRRIWPFELFNVRFFMMYIHV